MQQKECMIIRDLLPSYIEQLTNDTTTLIIKEHLEQCKGCQEQYQEQLFLHEEEKRNRGKIDKKFFGKLRRYRYQLWGGFIGIMLPFLAVAGWFGYRVWVNQNTTIPVVHTENAAEYGDFTNYRGLSELALFPEKEVLAENSGELLKYAYDCDEHKLYQTCQIYLECEYTAAAFEKEAERLQNITNEETGKAVKYSEEMCSYPAIYAMLNQDGCNEYALLLEQEQRIIYVYLQGVVDRRELLFEEKYLPLEYGQNGIELEGVEAFSIYPETW